MRAGCVFVIADQGDLLPAPVTGYQLDASGRIVSIAPHSAAADAGLRIGDRLDPRTFLSRSTEVTFIRGTTRLSTTVVPRSCAPALTRTAFGILQAVEYAVGLIAALVIAVWLASVRPVLMTLGLFLAMLNFPNGAWSPFLPEWANRAVVALSTFVTFNGLWAGLLIFASRFPNDSPRWIWVRPRNDTRRSNANCRSCGICRTGSM